MYALHTGCLWSIISIMPDWQGVRMQRTNVSIDREAEGSRDGSPAHITFPRAEGQSDTAACARLLLAGTSAELSHVAQLLSSQFTIDTVLDPHAVLETARATAPDLVIVDANLAERDGARVLSEIRADRTLGEVPIIILSRTCWDPRTAEIGIIADDDLRWPFSDHELLARISRMRLYCVRVRRVHLGGRMEVRIMYRSRAS